MNAYTAGYASILRAEHAENLAAASIERRRAHRRVSGLRRRRIGRRCRTSRRRVRLDHSMHEAYTYLGYANRKLGRYGEALHAYEQALKINPDTPYAIEYQGEAFLGPESHRRRAASTFCACTPLDQTRQRSCYKAMRRGWKPTKKNRQRASMCQRWRRGREKPKPLKSCRERTRGETQQCSKCCAVQFPLFSLPAPDYFLLARAAHDLPGLRAGVLAVAQHLHAVDEYVAARRRRTGAVCRTSRGRRSSPGRTRRCRRSSPLSRQPRSSA